MGFLSPDLITWVSARERRFLDRAGREYTVFTDGGRGETGQGVMGKSELTKTTFKPDRRTAYLRRPTIKLPITTRANTPVSQTPGQVKHICFRDLFQFDGGVSFFISVPPFWFLGGRSFTSAAA
jgi:hypothetical protein